MPTDETKTKPNTPEPGRKPSGDRGKPIEDKNADASIGTKSVRGSNRAVVVGINDYDGTINDLPSCIQDARAFSQMLADPYGFKDIKQLLDGDATISNVTDALREMFSGAAQTDRLVFFYSGHGSTQTKNGVLEECIVLHDGFYFDDELSKLSQSNAPGILTVVLDSCFSGGMEKNLLMAVTKGFKVVDRVQIKAFTRPNIKDFIVDLTSGLV